MKHLRPQGPADIGLVERLGKRASSTCYAPFTVRSSTPLLKAAGRSQPDLRPFTPACHRRRAPRPYRASQLQPLSPTKSCGGRLRLRHQSGKAFVLYSSLRPPRRARSITPLMQRPSFLSKGARQGGGTGRRRCRMSQPMRFRLVVCRRTKPLLMRSAAGSFVAGFLRALRFAGVPFFCLRISCHADAEIRNSDGICAGAPNCYLERPAPARCLPPRQSLRHLLPRTSAR